MLCCASHNHTRSVSAYKALGTVLEPYTLLSQANHNTDAAERDWAEYQARLAAHDADVQQQMEEKMQANSACSSTVASVTCPLLGLLFIGVFVWTLTDYPLLPLQLEDVYWARRWLLLSVVDFYACALCFVGIVLASESRCSGLFWSLLILSLGAPVACLYLVVRVCRFGSLSLLTMRDAQYLTPGGTDSGPVTGYVSGFYVVAGVAFGLRLLWTAEHYPLYLLQDYLVQDPADQVPAWYAEWLFTSIGDLVTLAFCFCGVICSTESVCVSLLWCFAMLVGGGPAACFYVTTRAAFHQSITLQKLPDDWCAVLRTAGGLAGHGP